MGLLDIFKRKSIAEVWTARLDDTEKNVQADCVNTLLDDALTKIEMGENEFFVFSPSSPINNITFMQTCISNENGMLHIEVGLNEKTENGTVKILYCDGFTVGKALDLFMDFYKGKAIDLSEWDLLELMPVKLPDESGKDKIDALISESYEQKYFDECKYIWKNYVPKSGQADNLQGELLREIEKIRYEAQDNGNINWDEDFSYFCDFISGRLREQPIFSDEDKEKIRVIMDYIKECGIYTSKYLNGEIPEERLEVKRMAYTEDNLYNIIGDYIGQLQRENPEPIPYERNEEINR